MNGRLLAGMQAIPLYSMEQGTLVYGELSAYEKGIAMIETYLSILCRELLLKEATSFGLVKWEESLALDGADMDVPLRRKNAVDELHRVQGMAEPFYAQNRLNAINTQIVLVAKGNEITLQNVAHNNKKELNRLARLLLPLVSPITSITLGGSGKTWAQWEKDACSWNENDKAGHPFAFLDTI